MWTIPTEPYSGAHFATFPTALVERCIKAGTSERGCCPECGAPWERVVERLGKVASGPNKLVEKPRSQQRRPGASPLESRPVDGYGDLPRWETRMVGWQPTCSHDAAPVPCVVLDPFAGTFTVGAVAEQLQRRAIGIELNPEYCDLAAKRCGRQRNLFAPATV